MKSSRMWRIGRTLALSIAVSLFSAACAPPVGVNRIETRVAHRLLTENVLSSGTLSTHSVQVLHRLDLYEKFQDEPQVALAQLHARLLPRGDEARLFALAELSFLYAEQNSKQAAGWQKICHPQKGRKCPDKKRATQSATKNTRRSYYLAAAVYAYALLFPEAEYGTPLEPSDPRLRLTYELYNQGLSAGLATPDGEEVVLQPGQRGLPFGTINIAGGSPHFSWAGYQLERFVPAANFAVRGLRNRYRRAGIGAPLAASLADKELVAQTPGASRIPPRLKVPVTAFLRLSAPRQGLTLGRLQGALELYSQDNQLTVNIDGRSHPLEFETSFALAHFLEESPVWEFDSAGFLSGSLKTFADEWGRAFQFLPGNRSQDSLYLLHPYRPGRIPVVLVHGTFSSPATWSQLINELEHDPDIWEHYQLWLFLYTTGNPIAYSGGLLRQALSNTMQALDPDGKDKTLQQMVVIGHSQGGLLTKLTAINSGTRFWDNVSNTPFADIDIEPETRDILQRSAFFEPLPFVKRVVFISTPHRGSYRIGLQLRQLASWLVTLPTDILKRTRDVVTRNQDELLMRRLEKPPTSIDNMNPSNHFITTLASLPVDKGVQAHSIIAVQGDGPVEDGSDGIVAYQSAHIEGVTSELVVRSGHSAHTTPQAIEEVRRILLEHLRGVR